MNVFAGFSADFLPFFKELHERQDRAWFAEQKARYEKVVKAPMRALVEEPDILLLDEPTNHLDLDVIQWLERFLKSYRGAVLCVSHDRTFLANISNKNTGRIWYKMAVFV